MRGVIMETNNGRAVLLTKGGEFVNIKNKGYSIGDKVNITSNISRMCTMAASFVIVCAGIGSYFIPTGYVSIDINPSLMMTLNMYNRVIDVTSFNDDARMLLNKTDIRGKSAEESVEMLIDASEAIGYINDSNRDVILEVVPGIRKPNIDGIKHENIELTNEIADRETLRIAQNIGVSIAKVKAIEEYTEKNGGDMRSNAVKFNDKSVKEIRNIMLDNGNLPDKKPSDAPKVQEPKNENISEPPKPPANKNYKPPYNRNDNSFPIAEPKHAENIPIVNQPPKNEYKPPEYVLVQSEDKPTAIPTELNEPPRWDFTEKPQDNSIVPNKLEKPSEPIQEKLPAEDKPMQTEHQSPNKISNHGGSEPKNEVSEPKQDIPEPGNDEPQNDPEPIEPKQENHMPPQDRPKPQENPPMPNDNIPQNNEPRPIEPKHEDGPVHDSNQPPHFEPPPPNDGGNNMMNEDMGGHNENREML